MSSNLPTLAVDFAFGYTPNDASPVWTTVTSFGVPSLSTKRGRAFELDQIQPGTATITLDNRDGRYTPPGNTPYAGKMLLRVPVRVRATRSAVTYDVWRGYVDRIPVTWAAGGVSGTATVQAVDLITLLSKVSQDFGALGYTALADDPAGFWPLDEAAGATTGRQIATSSAQLATILRSISGSTPPTFGQSLPLLVGAGSSPQGAKFNGSGATFANGGCLTAPLGATISGNFSVECWVQTPIITLGSGQQFGLARLYTAASLSSDPPGILVARAGLGGLLGSSYSGAASAAGYLGSFLDGNLHHVVLTRGGSFVFLYVDGYPVASSSDASSGSFDTISIGGSLTASGAADVFTGTIAAVGVYDFDLQYAQVQARYQAGLTAYAGDLTGQRVSRLIGFSDYPVATAIDAGSTKMSPALLSGQTLQQSLQDAVSTERGRLFVAGDGTFTFLGRAAEYNQSPVAIFGENVAGGELPYSDLTYSYDPDYLFNDITVTCPTGSARVVDQASIDEYGRSATTVTIESSSDVEARSLAQYLLVRFRQPQLRVASVTIKPDSNPALWPIALGLDIGDVVGHNRRPPNAPAILGATYVVDSVAHTVDANASTWQTVFELSPLLSGVHFWKLEDTTYGQIDNPAILISP